MALNAVLLMVRLADPVDRLMWVVAGAALHLSIGCEVALAAEHSDRLESSQCVGVIT